MTGCVRLTARRLHGIAGDETERRSSQEGVLLRLADPRPKEERRVAGRVDFAARRLDERSVRSEIEATCQEETAAGVVDDRGGPGCLLRRDHAEEQDDDRCGGQADDGSSSHSLPSVKPLASSPKSYLSDTNSRTPGPRPPTAFSKWPVRMVSDDLSPGVFRSESTKHRSHLSWRKAGWLAQGEPQNDAVADCREHRDEHG